MATVGSSWVQLCYWENPTGYGSYVSQLRLIAYSSQNVSNNTSTIHFKWQKSITGGSAYWADSHTYGVSFGGKYLEWSFAFGTVSSTSWVDCAGEQTMTITHNDDGSKSGTMYCSGYKMWEYVEGSASITLPTIARASAPTATPNPLTIGSSGGTLTVNTNRKSSSFMHTIKVECGSWSWTSSARAVGASVNVTVPYSVIAQFSATSKTATATVTCTTFSGTTQVGSAKTCSVTFQINTSHDHPNVGTITISDTNTTTSAVVQDNTKYVAYMSTLTASIPLTTSGSYTQLASATVTCGTKTQTYTLSGTSQTVTFTFAKVNASSLSVTVKDKRGTSASGSKTWTLLSYSPPTLTATVSRPSATGSTATGKVTGNAYGGSYGASTNSLTISYQYKLHTASTWTSGANSYTQSLTSGVQTYTKSMTFSESFPYTNQYDVKFTVRDLFSTVTYTAQLMQGLPILSWDETEVDVFGNLHIHDRSNPTIEQDVMTGFDRVWRTAGQKNLLPRTVAPATVNGITYAIQYDGTIYATGTATADSSITNEFTYTGSTKNCYYTGCPNGGSETTYDCYIWDVTNNRRALQWDNSTTVVSTYNESDPKQVRMVYSVTYRYVIRIRSGQTVDMYFKPMIRDGAIASNSFERFDTTPYAIIQATKSASQISDVEFATTYVLGRLCIFTAKFTVSSTISTSTAVLFTGLPPARAAFRTSFGEILQRATQIRVLVNTDGTLKNAWTNGGIPAGQYEGQVVYIMR